ncbi:hypothetical protein Sgly_0343 [Syntrophobotulus glycolicus DSM 8271]|uniref:Uncharacterized protein n=1 Tax=Syntrophobotulus glycolicus (strain DSM 8271 / FlGlyR) TaxID=645991 RepID=F0SXG3_SYNGF|nr:DUF6751 family protein [Syntrophobotulus glycolicus]ADY54709.1 hypothetical protein Sgly_0343 [Syntrophobotulus glycolicus DSM 8271]
MFPHTVTIYNKYIDTGIEKWQRTVISGVFWNSSKGAAVRKTGVSTVDGLQLIIPFSASSFYVKPKEWAALEDKSGHWTLQSGDIVILGEQSYEVVKSSSELKQFDDVLTITNVDTRDYGGSMSHWEVSGK